MPAVHATTARALRVKAPRPADSGHLIRGVGFTSECTCGWHSKRCDSWNAAVAAGREHLAEHVDDQPVRIIPPPGTVPPTATGEDAHPTREREG